MAHYTGPKARINRRLGAVIFESAGAIKSFDRRPDAPPGMHLRRGKRSDYALALAEKQKIKYYYGLGERQLRRYLNLAHGSENSGGALLCLCERRLDNIVRRAGLTLTRPQARQGVAHGHFLVGGRKATAGSMLLRTGDVIDVRRRPNLATWYRDLLEQRSSPLPDWLEVDDEMLRVRVLRLPGVDDVSLPVQVNLVIELLSR